MNGPELSNPSLQPANLLRPQSGSKSAPMRRVGSQAILNDITRNAPTTGANSSKRCIKRASRPRPWTPQLGGDRAYRCRRQSPLTCPLATFAVATCDDPLNVDSCRLQRAHRRRDGVDCDKSTNGRGRQEPQCEPRGGPELESVHSGWGRPRSQDFSCANDGVVDGRCALIAVTPRRHGERVKSTPFGHTAPPPVNWEQIPTY